ncbi:hypothetical protein GCM10029963_48180 [Micromonospora andamanensis]
MRAVTRRLSPDGSQPGRTPADERRSAVVDCALYLDGKRQAGDWDYADALAAAAASSQVSCGSACTSRSWPR